MVTLSKIYFSKFIFYKIKDVSLVIPRGKAVVFNRLNKKSLFREIQDNMPHNKRQQTGLKKDRLWFSFHDKVILITCL